MYMCILITIIVSMVLGNETMEPLVATRGSIVSLPKTILTFIVYPFVEGSVLCQYCVSV